MNIVTDLGPLVPLAISISIAFGLWLVVKKVFAPKPMVLAGSDLRQLLVWPSKTGTHRYALEFRVKPEDRWETIETREAVLFGRRRREFESYLRKCMTADEHHRILNQLEQHFPSPDKPQSSPQHLPQSP